MSSETRLCLFLCQILSQLVQEGKCVQVITGLHPESEIKTFGRT